MRSVPTGSVPMGSTPTGFLNRRTAILFALAVLAAIGGFVCQTSASTAAAVQRAGPELTMLLRFMAVLKGGAALGFLLLAAWRFRFPLSRPIAASATVSIGLMCAAASLIWQMAHVALGAGLFHLGLLMILGTAWADRGATGAVMQLLVARRRAAT